MWLCGEKLGGNWGKTGKTVDRRNVPQCCFLILILRDAARENAALVPVGSAPGASHKTPRASRDNGWCQSLTILASRNNLKPELAELP